MPGAVWGVVVLAYCCRSRDLQRYQNDTAVLYAEEGMDIWGTSSSGAGGDLRLVDSLLLTQPKPTSKQIGVDLCFSAGIMFGGAPPRSAKGYRPKGYGKPRSLTFCNLVDSRCASTSRHVALEDSCCFTPFCLPSH